MKEELSKGYRQYPKNVVNMWDDFISWERRKQGEDMFFIHILKKYNVKTVLDIACGTGYDSISLIKEGFKIKSCDGSQEMIDKAKLNAKKENINLDIKQCDWRNLVENYSEKFDAVVCLGNSFTHLFSEKDRESVMNQIYFLLNPNGILIIDQRNYDYILERGYKSKHKYVYCGETINVNIIDKNESLVRFKYVKNGNGFFTLDMYPIKIEEMKNLLGKVGFRKIQTYGDFEGNFDLENTDFIQHIAIK